MKNKLIVIVGPTAIGKTALSIEVAKKFDAEIISADSRQFYKELKIGVASPTTDELGVINHHFIGHLSITAYYNVSRFEDDVLYVLGNLFNHNKYAVITGGSGLYIDAVCQGIDEFPDPDGNLRNSLQLKLKEEGLEPLKKQLQQLDPEHYEIVDKNNPNRILRALEVCLMTGKTFTSQRNQQCKKRNFDIIKIGLDRPRAELFEIIEKRVDKMIDTGLVDEVSDLLQYRQLNSLNTVGYKEIFKFLDGNWTLEKAIEKIKTHTRRYAKRQLTWFKKDDSINWFHPDDNEKIIHFIENYGNKATK